MTEQIRLASDFALPADAVTQTFAILAKRGVGKTYTALVLVEELLGAGAQVVIADPVGVTWGLRAAANGKDPGLPIIVMGGDHGDVPLEASAGKVVAEFVVDTRSSVVLDLSLLRKGDQVRFMTDFAETLYHRNRAPLHLVLDEADAFAPQRPLHGQERMLGAIQDLVRRGRARGIGVTLVTQRAAVLSKDVLTQVEVLVALRTIAPQDRAAIEAWIQAHDAHGQRDEFMASLASLPIGTAWFWSPGWLDVFQKVKVRQRRTFDSSATPKVGATPAGPKKLAEVDLEALKGQIAATIEKAKAEDPRELRKRIGELEGELRKRPTSEPASKEKRVEVKIAVTKEPHVRRLEVTTKRLDGAVGRFEKAAAVVASALTEALASRGVVRADELAAREATKPAPVTFPGDPRSAPPASTRAAPPRPTSAHGPGDPDVGGGGLRRILIALAQRPQGLTLRQIGVRAGLSSRSGTFSTYMSRGRQRDWIRDGGPGGASTITGAGLEALGKYEPLPTGRDLLEHWLRELGESGAARILRAVAEAYPEALSLEEVGKRADLNPRSGTFSTYLSRLRTLELIEGRGMVRASGELV